jgi:Zn-dependent protease
MLALVLLRYQPGWSALKDFATISLLMAAENMLPIPPLDGTRVFFASRMTFAIIGGAIIATLAGYLAMAQISLLLMALGAAVGGIAWWYYAEKED